jgi:hypothetical protein
MIGIGRLHTRNHNRTVMVSSREEGNTISDCGLARNKLIRLRLGEDAMGAADW